MTLSRWNEEELKGHFAQCRTLKEVISSVENEFQAKGEVICEIRVNGMALDCADEDRFAENSVEGIHNLEIKSQRPQILIEEALQSGVELIQSLEVVAVNTSESIRAGEGAKASKLFSDLVDGCQCLVETLISLRSAANKLGRALSQAERWYSAEQVLGQAISDLSEAYIAGDTVLTADLIEYELNGAIEAWKGILTAERR